VAWIEEFLGLFWLSHNMDEMALENEEAGQPRSAISVLYERLSGRKHEKPLRYARIILGWLVALLILYFIYQKIDLGSVIISLQTAVLRFLVLAVVLNLIAHGMRVFKWHLVLRDEYSLLDVAMLFFSSKALGDLSPGRVGEFAPLLSSKYHSGKAAALILVDRFFEAYASLFYGVLGILLLRFQDMRIIVGGGIVLLVSCVVFVLLALTNFWRRLLGMVERWQVLARGVGIIVAVSEGFGKFKHLSWVLWLVSMVAKLIGLFFFQMLFLSVDVYVSLPLAAVMVFTIAFSSLIAFTPWGLGIIEAPLWWIGRLYDLPAAGMGAFYVLVRFIPLSSVWILYGVTVLINRYRKAKGC
jgi:hypothetical protein